MRHPFLRTLAGSAAPAATDPNFENVTLLLHGDGTNGGQNNTFVDGSTNNFTITRNGNTTQGTFSPYGDLWSNYFDGTGDYLTVPDNAAFDFGTGNFTIEAWVYIAGNSSLNGISTREATVVASFPTSAVGSLTNSWGFNLTGNGTTTGVGLNFSNWQSGSNSVVSATVTIPQTSWNHIAVARSGTTTKLFLNGAEVGSGTLSNQTVNSGQNLAVGRLGYPSYIQEVNGYISNVRVLKGTAQYTGTYTVPTSPLTSITNTSLLTCQSNRFRDASTNNFTITRNGDVSVQRFSPFSPTAAYAAGTIGGSGYFDGTGDNIYVSSASGLCNFASGEAFTFQLWIYRIGTGEMVFIGGGSQTFQMGVVPGGGFRYSKPNVADVFYGPGTCPLYTWTHCTLCRDTSNRTRLWVNGVSVASTTTDTNAYNLAATYIGSQPAGTSPTNGYLSDMRILKGQALYDPTSSANIAVPTAPLSAVANTSFLLNFTNAAILDNAMMAVPETVGNAQIDTTTKKFGTGSLEFDGTGDNLLFTSTPNIEFGSGDFTMEFWVNFTSAPSSAIVYEIWFATNAVVGFRRFAVFFYANELQIGYAGTTIATTGSITWTTGQWYHIAIVRNGSSWTTYRDGTSAATGTNSNSLEVGAAYRLGTNINGYIDDLRITKGVARYTSNFTPPTAAFPDL